MVVRTLAVLLITEEIVLSYVLDDHLIDNGLTRCYICIITNLKSTAFTNSLVQNSAILDTLENTHKFSHGYILYTTAAHLNAKHTTNIFSSEYAISDTGEI